jgi:hypothetical protein
MYKILKSILRSILESKISINKINNEFKGKTVLLLGDGISAAYAKSEFKKYDAIIACNNAINNKYLENSNLIFHVIMEPNFLFPWKQKAVRTLLKNSLKSFPRTKIIMNPFGRIFNFLYKFKNVIYISPYHKIIRDQKVIYDDFSAAFQASLGIAILSGFEKIDCIGFDAWLLTPKNNLRWYFNTISPHEFDYTESKYSEKFIIAASKVTKLSVLTYGHYRSSYSFIIEKNMFRK